MTQKHTAGPWAVMPSSNPRNGTAWRDIVSLGCEFSPSYVGEALEHDAALIASAPDLLAENDRLRQLNSEFVTAAELALALIKNTWIPDHGNPEVGNAWGALHSALNKAKGQS